MDEASAIEVDDAPEIIRDRKEAQPEPPQNADDAFWSRMGAMFDLQKDCLSHEMTCRLRHLAAEVKTEINVEFEHRMENMREVNNKTKAMDDKSTVEKERCDMTRMSNAIEELAQRVVGLEGATTQEPAVHRSSWVVLAIVIGTWPFGTEPEQRRREALPILASPTGMEYVLVAPERSSIVKVEVEGPHAAGAAQLKGLASTPTMNKWCGLERDPDIAAKQGHSSAALVKVPRHHVLACGAGKGTKPTVQRAAGSRRYFSRRALHNRGSAATERDPRPAHPFRGIAQ